MYIDYKMHDFGLYAVPSYKRVAFHVKQLLLNRQYIMLKIRIRQKRVWILQVIPFHISAELSSGPVGKSSATAVSTR